MLTAPEQAIRERGRAAAARVKLDPLDAWGARDQPRREIAEPAVQVLRRRSAAVNRNVQPSGASATARATTAWASPRRRRAGVV